MVSYVGYETREVPVNGRTEINITLADNSVLLGEVVAIGYGVVKKSDATGSVATIKPSEIEAGLATSAQDLPVGASPGVVVTTSGNPPKAATSRSAAVPRSQLQMPPHRDRRCAYGHQRHHRFIQPPRTRIA